MNNNEEKESIIPIVFRVIRILALPFIPLAIILFMASHLDVVTAFIASIFG